MSQPVPQPAWKQEVNRRLEAHKSRKGLSVVPENSDLENRNNVSDRAAQAAARVAARFSKAPSYGDMQAAEARAALRNAEVATRAALEAQALAQVALDNLQRDAERSFEFDEEEEQALPSAPELSRPAGLPENGFKIRWEPDMPAFAPESSPVASASTVQPSAQDEFSAAIAPAAVVDSSSPMEWVEGAKPIHANLIQFPREIVATRRIRPRLAECPQQTAEELYGQLSIFEVDPSSVSVEPMASSTVETALPAPSWSGPEWSSIEFETVPEEAKEEARQPQAYAPQIHLAPLRLRMMAATIDLALTIGMMCAGTAGIAAHMTHAPSIKAAEIGAGVAFVLIAIFYQAFFQLTTLSTPGMMYAGIAFCNFEDELPTHAELRNRLGAAMVSLLPLGLGLAWSIFDEDHLSWHDRLSRTYQRRC